MVNIQSKRPERDETSETDGIGLSDRGEVFFFFFVFLFLSSVKTGSNFRFRDCFRRMNMSQRISTSSLRINQFIFNGDFKFTLKQA